MKSLKITKDWDIDIDNNGNLIPIDGYEELCQTASHAVYTIMGEDPFNPNRGVPYFEDIIGGSVPRKSLIESYYRYEVKDIDGIDNLYLVDDNYDNINRNYTAKIYITTNNKNQKGV